MFFLRDPRTNMRSAKNNWDFWTSLPEALHQITRDGAEPLSIEGAADHWNHRADPDHFSQPGALFRLMTPAQQQVLFENTARSVGAAPREIQLRHIGNCIKADPAYGRGVAKSLGIAAAEIPG